MFGQNNDDASGQDANTPAENQENNQPESTPVIGEGVNGPAPVASAATAPSSDDSFQQLNNSSGSNDNDSTNSEPISPAGGFPNSASNRLQGSGPVLTFENDDQADQSNNSDDAPALVTANDVADASLVDIKQKALSELAPLIDELDQTPTEKFRTIMMMIQASDDQSLVEKAYETAHSIEDEKARAQALLDIVNEINYFTQAPLPEHPAES